jgi:hypothetical protein
LLSSRSTPRELAWWAGIVLATADGQGTVGIMRRTGIWKPAVWRWQERYLDEGVPWLRRDKTRPSRVLPLPSEVRPKVIAKTARETPTNATQQSRATVAGAVGISPSSVGQIWADAGLKMCYRLAPVSRPPAATTTAITISNPPEITSVEGRSARTRYAAAAPNTPSRESRTTATDADTLR